MQTRNIFTPNLAIFCLELQTAFDDGFRLDEENLPTTWGTAYEAVLVKDEHRAAIMDAFKEAPGEMNFSVVASLQETQKQEAPKRGRPKA